MGTSSYQADADRVNLNGAYRNVPGFEDGDYAGDQQPHFIFSGSLDLVTAVADQTPIYFPFAGKIVAIKIRVRVAAGTGDAIVYVGTTADNDRFAATTVATTDAAGTILTSTLLNSGTIVKDSVLVFGADGGATATGSVDVTVIWVPAK